MRTSTRTRTRTRTRSACVAAAALALLGTVGTLAPSASAVDIGAAGEVRYEKETAALAADPDYLSSAAVTVYCDEGWQAASVGQTIPASERRAIGVSVPQGTAGALSYAWQEQEAAATLNAFAVCLKTSRLTINEVREDIYDFDVQITRAVPCAGGHVVGGGMQYFHHDSAIFDGLALNASYPVDDDSDADTVPDDGWRSYGQFTGNAGDEVEYAASCLGGPRPAYKSKTVQVPGGQAVSAQALCPTDRPAIGGGVWVSGAASRSHVIASRPWDGVDSGSVPEDGWRAGVQNTSADPVTMTVHAICR